jgi:multidrug efflux pump subunit AcrB
MSSKAEGKKFSGPLAWMANNSVAANVLMIVLIVGGLLMASRVKQEVFPVFDLDLVLIQVPYPGASPAEVEQGVVLAVEEAVRGIDGVKEVRSTCSEGVAVVAVELMLGVNSSKALSDVKSAVDRISSFPVSSERPVISLAAFKGETISLVLHGDQSEATLRKMADRTRSDLLQSEKITTVELTGIRPLEISIDVPQEKLRRYGLTLEQISMAVRNASVEVPGGVLKTKSGEVLLRTTERRDSVRGFEDIVIRSKADGTVVQVRDVGNVSDGFREIDQMATFNGQRAVMIKVFRVGDQKPLEIAEYVKKYAKDHEKDLPPGVHFSIWNDTAEIYGDRIDLLKRNAISGLILVILSLGLFLDIKLALWVTLGIPISFAGSMLFLPASSVSINMISLFAFIVTLGMVVDDAIVVGEAVYFRRSQGVPPLEAAIEGVKEVAVPVTFSVLTTCVAFAPMFFVPGPMGKFFVNIPVVVIGVLLISLVESLFILPAHLAHAKPFSETGFSGVVFRQQQRFSKIVEWFIEKTYRPVLNRAVHHRYITLAIAIAMLTITVGVIKGGRIKFSFIPAIEADYVVATLNMPFGTAAKDTEVVQKQLLKAADEVAKELIKGKDNRRGTYALLGTTGAINRGGPAGAQNESGSHISEIGVNLGPAAERTYSAQEFTERWRKKVENIPGIESLTFLYATASGGGKPIDFELSHSNLHTLERAAKQLGDQIKEYPGVHDLDDGFSAGKEQLDITLRPEARSLGLSEAAVAGQVRNAFYGSEATRQQRGRDELRVYVRRPRSERESLQAVEQFLIRTPMGGEIALGDAAVIRHGRAYTEIQRVDGQRVVHVTGDVGRTANATELTQSILSKEIPEINKAFPDLRVRLGGEQKSQKETVQALGIGFTFALLIMFAMMAIPFKSYIQPLIIMVAIPFGFVGAVIGHIIMGFDLSMISMMGLVALAGVAVNDSLVLVDSINEQRRQGESAWEAVIHAGTRRFRPILLTSLTTFFGLMPMMLEKSVQARFLIPMAISLGFGVMFATFITLLLVPSLYLILEDVSGGISKAFHWIWGEPKEETEGTDPAPPVLPPSLNDGE